MGADFKRIYIHGLMGSSRGFKAGILRGLFPDMVIPDFGGALQERMMALDAVLS